ncbi:MAG: DUF2384 domain-containing protein [Agitococcus sp.]|nr:DUF2384 domain-containing protein [Agitococcus sp.]MDO9177070.1 DUF2384 domain-containing protein [Agitococcus sp.]
MMTLSDLLGLPSAPSNGLAWHDLLQAGLPRASLEVLATHLNVEVADLIGVLGVRHNEELLTSGESDQLYRVALALRQSMIVSRGSLSKAVQWLKTPNPNIRGRVPLGLVSSYMGAEFVLTALERLKPTPKELAEKPEESEE